MNPIIQNVKNNLDLTQGKSLKLALYDAFRETILKGEIPAGTRVNEKEFSECLNISRTPIRYALAELKKEKLVEHIPKTGIIIKGIKQKDALEIYDIRKALDTLATIKAMQRMTVDDFDELHQLLLAGKKYHKNGETDKVMKNFTDFNNFIYDKSQMLRLKAIVTEVQAYLFYFRELSISSDERRAQAIKEHLGIYEGMCHNDIETITKITHEHLDRSLKFIIQEMEHRGIE